MRRLPIPLKEHLKFETIRARYSPVSRLKNPDLCQQLPGRNSSRKKEDVTISSFSVKENINTKTIKDSNARVVTSGKTSQ